MTGTAPTNTNSTANNRTEFITSTIKMPIEIRGQVLEPNLEIQESHIHFDSSLISYAATNETLNLKHRQQEFITIKNPSMVDLIVKNTINTSENSENLFNLAVSELLVPSNESRLLPIYLKALPKSQQNVIESSLSLKIKSSENFICEKPLRATLSKTLNDFQPTNTENKLNWPQSHHDTYTFEIKLNKNKKSDNSSNIVMYHVESPNDMDCTNGSFLIGPNESKRTSFRSKMKIDKFECLGLMYYGHKQCKYTISIDQNVLSLVKFPQSITFNIGSMQTNIKYRFTLKNDQCDFKLQLRDQLFTNRDQSQTFRKGKCDECEMEIKDLNKFIRRSLNESIYECQLKGTLELTCNNISYFEIPYRIEIDEAHAKITPHRVLFVGEILRPDTECVKEITVFNVGTKILTGTIELSEHHSQVSVSFAENAEEKTKTFSIGQDASQEFKLTIKPKENAREGYFFSNVLIRSSNSIEICASSGQIKRGIEKTILIYGKIDAAKKKSSKESGGEFKISNLKWYDLEAPFSLDSRTEDSQIIQMLMDVATLTDPVQLSYLSLWTLGYLFMNDDIQNKIKIFNDPPKNLDIDYSNLVADNVQKSHAKFIGQLIKIKDTPNELKELFKRPVSLAADFFDITSCLIRDEGVRNFYMSFSNLMRTKSSSGKFDNELFLNNISNTLQVISSSFTTDQENNNMNPCQAFRVAECFSKFGYYLVEYLRETLKFNTVEINVQAVSFEQTIVKLLEGFVNSDAKLSEFFEPLVNMIIKIVMKNPDDYLDNLSEFLSKTITNKHKYIGQVCKTLKKAVDLNDQAEDTFEKFTFVKLLNSDEKQLLTNLFYNKNTSDTIMIYLKECVRTFPILEKSLSRVNGFFRFLDFDYANLDSIEFDNVLGIFYNQDETRFLANLIKSLTLAVRLQNQNQIKPTENIIQRLAASVIEFCSIGEFNDDIGKFVRLCNSSNLADKREHAAICTESFGSFSDDLLNIVDKVASAHSITEVIDSFLTFLNITRGRNISGIYRLESALMHFISIESAVRNFNFHQVWPILIHISALQREAHNDMLLKISANLKQLYECFEFKVAIELISNLTTLIAKRENHLPEQNLLENQNQLENFKVRLNRLQNKLKDLDYQAINVGTCHNLMKEILNESRYDAIKKMSKLGSIDIDEFTIAKNAKELFEFDPVAWRIVDNCEKLMAHEMKQFKMDDASSWNLLWKFTDIAIDMSWAFVECKNDQMTEKDKIYLHRSFGHFGVFFKSILDIKSLATVGTSITLYPYLVKSFSSFLSCLTISHGHYKEIESTAEAENSQQPNDLLDRLHEHLSELKNFQSLRLYTHLLNSASSSKLNKRNSVNTKQLNRDVERNLLINEKNEIEKQTHNCQGLINKLFTNELSPIDKTNSTFDTFDQLVKNYTLSLSTLSDAASQWLLLYERFCNYITNYELENSSSVLDSHASMAKSIFYIAISILNFANAIDSAFSLVSNSTSETSLHELMPDLQSVRDKFERLKIDNDELMSKLITDVGLPTKNQAKSNKKNDKKKPGRASTQPTQLNRQTSTEVEITNSNRYVDFKGEISRLNPVSEITNNRPIVQPSQQINREVNNMAHLLLQKHRFDAINRIPNPNMPNISTPNSQPNASVSSPGEQNNHQANMIEQANKITNKIKQDIEEAERRMKDTSKKPEQWSYSLLKDSKPLMKATLLMVNSLIATYQKFLEENEQTKQIEWCLFIDNSESIKSSNKVNMVIQCVVVICELLRRLECKFAVARFGDPKDRFSLLKSFQTPMSVSVGEHIIESLTFDQGTLIENCMDNICERVWPQSHKNDYQHHVSIVITDGLILDTQVDQFNKTIKDYELKLGFLFLSEPLKEFQQVIRTFPQFTLTASNDIKNAFELIETLLNKAIIDNAKKGSDLIDIKCEIPNISERDYLLLDGLISSNIDLNKSLENENFSSDSNRNMFSISSLQRSNEADLSNRGDQSCIKEKFKLDIPNNDLADLITKVKDHYDLLEKQQSQISADIERCHKSWIQSESLLSKEIGDYEEVLQDVVMPNNKYTRKKGDSKGSSLYIPGLIKAVVSDFSYNKIFASKTSGGCRNYNVYFCLDMSYSMDGQMQEFSIQALLSFITALSRMGIETFTIIVFAETVKIVKLEAQIWDKFAVYTLFQSLAEKRKYATADAAALRTALNLCELSATSGPKKIFIFTDGFTSYPQSLRAVINEIEMKGIELVAIAIGYDKFFLHKYYKRYVTASLPSFVHKALRALYEMDQTLDANADENERLSEMLRDLSLKGTANVDEILSNRTDIFEKLQQELHNHQGILLALNSNPGQLCRLSNTNKTCNCTDCSKTVTIRLEPKLNEFRKRLEREGGQLGIIQISLAWNNYNDLDLHCIDPNGEEIYYGHRTAISGGKLDVDMNAGGKQSNVPVENIVWVNNPPRGTYRVYVNFYAQHDDALKTDFEVLISAPNNTPLIFPGQISQVKEKRLIHQFNI